MKNTASREHKAHKNTGIILIPLVLWIAHLLIGSIKHGQIFFDHALGKHYNLILINLFAAFGLYHGFLGAKQIFNDYLRKPSIRCSLFLIIIAVTTASFVTLTFALMYHQSL